MKKHIAKLAVAGFCFIASPIQGSDEIPQSIPMGSSLLDFAVANNPCSFVMSLQNTSATGGLNTCGMFTNAISFGSYADFQSYVTVNALKLSNFFAEQNASDIYLTLKVSFGAGGPCPGLSINSYDVGNPTNISASTFISAIVPAIQSVVLPINGITNATVQFENGLSNSITLVGSNGIAMNQFLTNNGGRIRVTLSFDDGTTATYTQYGSLINPPTLSLLWIPAPPPMYDYNIYYDDGDTNYEYYLQEEEQEWFAWNQWYSTYGPYFYSYWYYMGYPYVNSYNVVVSGSYGADTEIDCTADFITWTPIGSIPWNSDSTALILPVQPNSGPMEFFRAKSY